MKPGSIQASGVVVCVVLLVASVGLGQDKNADQLVEKTEIDFGYVARGQTLHHAFILKNTFDKRLHITSVTSATGVGPRSSKLEKEWLDPGESVAINLKWNTLPFMFRKSEVVTVVVDQPSYRQVRLLVSATVRSDIVLSKGEFDFGDVTVGAEPAQAIKIEYAGKPDWKIAKASCPSKFVELVLDETHRDDGLVGYALKVALKSDAPEGVLKDHIVLEINDAYSKSLELNVFANVKQEKTESPNN